MAWSWDEWTNQTLDENLTGQIKTEIMCPECGRLVYYDSSVALTSYPTKYKYWCVCGWSEFSPFKWK